MMSMDEMEHENLDKKYVAPTLTANAVPNDVDYMNYRLESARLDSFDTWPVSFIDPKKLAAAGFFYTKKNDTVKCFTCLVSIRGWVEGDNPMVDHQRWSGRCKLVKNLPCGNVPIGVDPRTIPRVPRCADVCGPFNKYMPMSGPDEHPASNCFPNDELETIISDTNSTFKAKLCDVVGSKKPMLSTYERRLETFAQCPDIIYIATPKKEDLATAGFFCLHEYSDHVMCFYCGGFLKDWKQTDNPVQKHVKWFPTCSFINRLIAKKQLKEKEKEDNLTSMEQPTDKENCEP